MWTWHISVLIKALSHAAALAFLKWGRKQTGSFQLRIVDRQRCSIWAGFIPSLPWRRLSVVACVHVCVLANIRSHGRTGTPLRAAGHFLCKVLTGSLIFTHTHTQSLQHHPMHFNSYSAVERLQRFEQEHNLLQPHNTVLKSVPGHTVANSTGLIIF